MWRLRLLRKWCLICVAAACSLLAAPGTARAASLSVKFGSTVISQGGTFSYGTTQAGQVLSRTFTVTNTGSSAVIISPYSLSGNVNDPNYYQFGTISGPSPLNPGASSTFELLFFANANGTTTTEVRLFVGGTPAFSFFASTTVGAVAQCTNPDQELKELDSALRTGFPLGACEWRSHIRLDYNQWKVTGSMNLPVIAAAVALVAEPVQQGMDMSLWWQTYLEAQLGDRTTFPSGFPSGLSGTALPTALTFFHATEAFSLVYDSPVVTSVLAVHYWANANPTKPRAATIKSLARRYLRATWWVYALPAGPQSAATGYKNGVLHTDRLHRGSVGFFYEGPFIALGGARSKDIHFGEVGRGILLTRAMGLSFTGAAPSRENPGQAGVRTFVESWADVYGLSTNAERSALQGLAFNDVVPAALATDMTGIKTRSTFHFIAQTGFSGSCMEQAFNGNGEATFAVGFFPTAQIGTVPREAHFLYTGQTGGQGTCTVDLTNRKITVRNSAGNVAGTITMLPGSIVYHYRLNSSGLVRLQ